MNDTAESRIMQLRDGDDGGSAFAEASLAQDDQRWIAARLGNRKSARVGIQLVTDMDTEGHGWTRSTNVVHVRIASDELDLEGHAFALHFPSIPDADAFKRGVAAGAISATLLLGGVAGAMAISENHTAPAANAPAAAAPVTQPKAAPAAPVINIRWGTGRAIPQ